jgi:hypothetical protein
MAGDFLPPHRTLSCFGENEMSRLIPVIALSALFLAPTAEAVVYCKEVGIPKGCVMRPA